MIVSERISKSLVNVLRQNHKIEPEYEEAHKYCIEQLLDLMLYHISLLLLGLLIHHFLLTVVYIISLTPVKMFAGGAHANSRGMCSFLSYSIYLLSILLCPLIPHRRMALIILLLSTELFVFLLAPVCHPNKPLSAQQKRQMKQNLLIYLSFLTIIGFVFLITHLLIYMKMILLCLLITLTNQLIGIKIYQTRGGRRTWN